MIEALKLSLALYFIILAILAAWGQHREVLLFTGRVFLAIGNIFLWVFTLGRNGSLPVRRKIKNRGRRVRRSFRALFLDFSETHSDLSGDWVSGDKKERDDDALP